MIIIINHVKEESMTVGCSNLLAILLYSASLFNGICPEKPEKCYESWIAVQRVFPTCLFTWYSIFFQLSWILLLVWSISWWCSTSGTDFSCLLQWEFIWVSILCSWCSIVFCMSAESLRNVSLFLAFLRSCVVEKIVVLMVAVSVGLSSFEYSFSNLAEVRAQLEMMVFDWGILEPIARVWLAFNVLDFTMVSWLSLSRLILSLVTNDRVPKMYFYGLNHY